MLVRLKHSLQALAMPAEIQLSLFPDFVCKVDELALDFDNWATCVLSNDRGELTQEQRSCLAEIDSRLGAMSGEQNARYWTEEALRQGTEWEAIRNLSKMALKAFGWPVEQPPSYGHEYIPGARE